MWSAIDETHAAENLQTMRQYLLHKHWTTNFLSTLVVECIMQTWRHEIQGIRLIVDAHPNIDSNMMLAEDVSWVLSIDTVFLFITEAKTSCNWLRNDTQIFPVQCWSKMVWYHVLSLRVLSHCRFGRTWGSQLSVVEPTLKTKHCSFGIEPLVMKQGQLLLVERTGIFHRKLKAAPTRNLFRLLSICFFFFAPFSDMFWFLSTSGYVYFNQSWLRIGTIFAMCLLWISTIVFQRSGVDIYKFTNISEFPRLPPAFATNVQKGGDKITVCWFYQSLVCNHVLHAVRQLCLWAFQNEKNGSICDPKAFVAHRNTCDIGFKEFGTNIRGNNNSTIYLDHPSLDDSHLTSKKRIPFQHVVTRQHQPNGRDCELSIISHKSSCKEKANADNGKFTGKNGSLSYRNAMKLLMVN